MNNEMSSIEIRNMILSVLHGLTGDPYARAISDDASLEDELGLDELDFVELILELEDQLGVFINDEALEPVNELSINKLIQVIKQAEGRG